MVALVGVGAHADPEAIKVPAEMRADPAVAKMIAEYEKIAARSPKICNDKKLFGLQVVTVDGVKQVRYYVEDKGIACIPGRLRPSEQWLVKRYGWKDTDHQKWQQFVAQLGMAVEAGQCNSVDTCMISSANMLRTKTDAAAFHYADCADFPYYLRTYFSFRMNLPFSIATEVRTRPLSPEAQMQNETDENRTGELERRNPATLSPAETVELNVLLKKRKLRNDLRLSPEGNWIAKRSWILGEKDSGNDLLSFLTGGHQQSKTVRFYQWISAMQSYTSTATLRMSQNEHYSVELPNGEEIAEEEPDFYTPVLNPKGIVVGTVVYKHDGHTSIIYRIDYNTGNIYYIDSHPDNTLSHGVIDETWTRNMAGPSHLGGGFKNFRPIAYTGRDPQENKGILDTFFNAFTNRPAAMATDEQVGAKFSREQFDEFPLSNSMYRYRENGLNVDVNYNEFLRLRMSGGKYRVNPIEQFKSDLRRVCVNLQYRREGVETGTEKGFHLLPHPAKLPENIYSAQGDWEKYSSPGRDVVNRQRLVFLVDSLRKYKRMVTIHHPLLAPGVNPVTLKAEIAAAWNQTADSCVIGYKNSAGAEVQFTLREAIRRTPYMDFNPYLCPERRFGASSVQELATCTDTPDKTQWYLAQQFLRNRTEKTPNEIMGWSLPELQQQASPAVDPKLLEAIDIDRAISAL